MMDRMPMFAKFIMAVCDFFTTENCDDAGTLVVKVLMDLLG